MGGGRVTTSTPRIPRWGGSWVASARPPGKAHVHRGSTSQNDETPVWWEVTIETMG